MNRVYRRLWSRARQCWIVASERASSQGKAARGLRCTTVIASLLLTPALVQAETASGKESEDALEADRALQWAFGLPMALKLATTAGPTPVGQVSLTTDYSYRSSTVDGDHLVMLGSRSSLVGSTSVGYGNLIESRGDHNVAVGFGVKVRQSYSTAVGGSAMADGIGATAFGNNAKAYTNNSIAVGSGSSTDSGAGVSKIAIGGDARAGTGGWTGAMAIGGNASATHDSVALGYQATTTTTGAVALGRGSLANEADSVSVGNASTKRRIVNVADARLSTTSTDAVTGKQLHATNQNIATATSTANTARTTANTAKTAADSALAKATQATDLISQTAANGQVRVGANNTGTIIDVRNKSGAKRRIQNIDNGVLSTSSTDAVTGQQLHATNQGVTKAQSTADAINTRLGATTLAVGAGASAAGQYATATGHNSNAGGERAFAGGVNSVASGAHSSAVGSGAKATHTNSVALGAGSVTYSDSSVSVGNATLKRKIQYLADGGIAVGSTDAVTGGQLHATNQTVATAQAAATAAKGVADSALAKANTLGGLVGQVSATGSVRLGAENTGTVVDVRNKSNASRKLSGVADATLSASSTEAVTGKQLTATNTNVSTAQNAANAAQATANSATTTADSALGKANLLGGLVGQVSASGNLRLGTENTGAVLDVRNKANASRKISGVADAVLSSTSTEAVTGRQLTATNANLTTAHNAANAAQATATAALGRTDTLGGLVSQAAVDGAVRLGGENTGAVLDVRNKGAANRRISGVADGALGSASNEAVTGRQLHATNQLVDSQSQALTAHGQTLAAHGLQLQAQDRRIGDNRGDLDRLRSEFDDFDPDLKDVVRFAADGSVDLGGGKVRGVGAGDISSSTSTETINGGQLFDTNARIYSLEDSGRLIATGKEAGILPAEAGSYGVAIGNGALASVGSEGGTAIGSFSSALAKNSVAVGRGSLVEDNAAAGFALGAGSRVGAEGGVALGEYAEVNAGAADSVAVGAYSIASEEGTVSFGSTTRNRRLTNVARGTADHNVTTVAQLNEAIVALGGGAKLDTEGNVIAPAYNIQGATQETVGGALDALDTAVAIAGGRVDAVERQFSSVFQAIPTNRTDGLSQLSLVGINGMVLSNLADGRVAAGSRDAVTGNQLFKAKQDIERNRSDLDDLREGWGGVRWVDAASVAGVSTEVDFGGARLTGISHGRVSDSSSDAMTGAQLFETNGRVSGLELAGRSIAVSSRNDHNSPAKAGERSVAIGEYASASAVSEGGTAVGHYAVANAKNAVAIGESSRVSSGNEGGIAIGSKARADGLKSMAIGEGAWVFSGAEDSLAIGAGSEAMRSNEVSFGTYSNRRRLTNVANGVASYDAATAGQIRESMSVFGGGAMLDGQGNVVAPSYRIQGGQQSTVDAALTALDSAVVTSTSRIDGVESQLRSTFQDTPSTRSDGLNQLTFAGANGMVLSNVANGAIAAGSRDAVNGGQLHSLQQQLNGRVDGLEQRIDGQSPAPEQRALTTASGDAGAPPAVAAASPTPEETATPPAAGEDSPLAGTGNPPKASPQPKADAPQAPTPQVDTAELEKMLARANEYTDNAVSGIERRLEKMDKRFNRMAAMNSAQSAMAMNTAGLATYNRLGAGVGYSDGESAMAVGYQRVLNERGSATFSLNGAFTNSGEQSVGLGVGVGW
ncbi:YadA-like family protein [Bacillus subtilis subsp. subtilis]|nr:YadA-like family protein [Bacillus subtilis subsp. subtilis]